MIANDSDELQFIMQCSATADATSQRLCRFGHHGLTKLQAMLKKGFAQVTKFMELIAFQARGSQQ